MNEVILVSYILGIPLPCFSFQKRTCFDCDYNDYTAPFMNKYQQVQEVSNACEGVPRFVAVDYLIITWIKHWK